MEAVIPASPTGPDAPAQAPVISTPGVAPRPEWLPQEFATAEQFAEAYNTLKAGNPALTPPVVPAPAAPKIESKPGDPLTIPEPTVVDPSQDAPPADADAAAQSIVEKAGLQMDSLSTEVDTTGTLSDASFEALAKVGIPRDLAEDYVLGRVARIEAGTTQVTDSVGGADNYAAMLEWARNNLPADERTVYDSQVTAGVAQAKLAAQGLYSRFVASTGRPPTRTLQGGAGGGADGAFRSWAQVTAAMSDPRYSKDEAYRQDVLAKLANSGL